jgi:hypothetical protein
MTELSFLVDLLLNQKLPKLAKDLIAARIKEVEGQLSQPTTFIHGGIYGGNSGVLTIPTPQLPPTRTLRDPLAQAPSTQAILDSDKPIDHSKPVDTRPIQDPAPVLQVAQTAAAQQAMNARNDMIRAAQTGKSAPKVGGYKSS